jgi:hypothetical protein
MGGWTGSINVNKNQGDKIANAALWGVSPGFDSNDLGFQFRGDIAGAHALWLWKKPTPDRLTRERRLFVAKSWTWNFAGQRQHDGLFVFTNAKFLNYWSAYANLGVFRQTYDDRLTRGGPVALSPAAYFVDYGLTTDDRKKISLAFAGNRNANTEGSWLWGGNLAVTFKPTSAISVTWGPDVRRSRAVAQYVATAADGAARDTFGARYIFADFDQTEVSLTGRGHWILSPKMSLQVFAQPLVSGGRYWDYKQFARPGTFDFTPYGFEDTATFANPDFNFKSLRVNAVFRWEWALGSTLYLVWTENRQDLSNPGHVSLRRDVGRLFSAPADDVFLVRFSYWLSR